MNEKARVNYEKAEPKRNGPCYCGSGLKSKNCCGPEYKNFDDRSSMVTDALKDNQFNKALKYARLHTTKYLFWHRAHTVPMKNAGDVYSMFMDIDIRAFGETLELLMLCYFKNGIIKDFDKALDYHKSSLDSPRWNHWIVYLRASRYLVTDNKKSSEQKASEILSEIGNIDEVIDRKILELLLDTRRYSFPFSKRLEVYEKIIKECANPIDRLRHETSISIEYLLINERNDCVSKLDAAIQKFEASEVSVKDPADYFEAARTLNLLGTLNGRVEVQDKARAYYFKALESEKLSKFGREIILRGIADTFLHQKNFEKAVEYYDSAYAENPNEVERVFKIKPLFRAGRLQEAFHLADEITVEKLGKPELADYVFYRAELSLREGASIDFKKKSYELLKANEPKDQLFIDLKNELLLAMTTKEFEEKYFRTTERNETIFGTILRTINKYVIMQPSIAGFGIDLNKVFQRISGGEKSESED